MGKAVGEEVSCRGKADSISLLQTSMSTAVITVRRNDRLCKQARIRQARYYVKVMNDFVFSGLMNK
jgi:hypothetical protein